MKKRILAVLAAVALLSTTVLAASPKRALTVGAVVGDTELAAVEANGETYLFLPSGADIENLTLRVRIDGAAARASVTGENGSVSADSAFNIKHAASRGADGSYTVTLQADGVRKRVTVMVGVGLPTIYLQSDSAEEDRTWVDSDKENKTTGSMRLTDASGGSIYDGALTQIKARGNSTFRYYPKKAYQIKLEKKADLLGTGEKVKTWVLLANYGDATMQHDKLLKDLAASLGMPYTTSCGWVNLYYDGAYRGVYLLSEKVSVDSTGVDITDMEEAYESRNSGYGKNAVTAEGVNRYGQSYVYTTGLTEPENITGGWLIERNLSKLDEVNGFYTARGAAFNVKSPEWAGEAALEHISSFYQEFEDAVYAVDKQGNYTGYNAETGKYYYEYCDLSSLVQVYLIQNLALNVDAFDSSLFFYRDTDGILHAGPVWDMDISFGTGWSEILAPTREFVKDYRYLAIALIRIPSFRAAVEEYFTTIFLPAAERWLGESGTIAAQYDRLAPSAAMNYALWPYVRVGSPTNAEHLWADGTDFASVTDDLRDWVAQRLEVLRVLYYNVDYAPAYSDVPATHWAYSAVREATARGLLRGVGGGAFAPNAAVDQGTVYTVLARRSGENTAGGAAWYSAGMRWAAAHGLTTGDAADTLPREELVWALWTLSGAPSASRDLSDFADSGAISARCTEAMAWAVETGVLHGDGAGHLSPAGSVTRAELAQILANCTN